MPFEIIRNDITKVHTDAIVNAANKALKKGGGVCGAIFDAAGNEQLQKACDKIGNCNVGEAVLTPGYNLPAKYIIHTVGPIWQDGSYGEAMYLANCYKNSLKLAFEHNLESIAFPLISSGIYGYPKDQALRIAISTISKFLLKNDMQVYLVVYDKQAIMLSEKLFSSIKRYIDDNYIDEHRIKYQNSRSIEDYEIQLPEIYSSEMMYRESRSLDDVMKNLDESFTQMLLRLIDDKNMTDIETYKKANIDRRLFSKIRSDIGYKPSKSTAIAFAIALELSLDETQDLLSKAGFTLSHSSKFDLIIEFFIKNANYHIFEINEALFSFDQSLLGA